MVDSDNMVEAKTKILSQNSGGPEHTCFGGWISENLDKQLHG